jgi:hypothetical protein
VAPPTRAAFDTIERTASDERSHEGASMTKIERDVRFLRIYSFASTLLLAAALLAISLRGGPRRLRELEVERLTVVNPDGRLALAIAGKGKLPGPMLDGKLYPPETSEGRTSSAGMIFFNESGDEVGGLIYGGAARAGGYDAVVHLSMDQWKQDQVVVLQYEDDSQHRSAGLTVSDRPTDFPLSRMRPKVAAWKSATGQERERLHRELEELDRQGKFGAPRVFLGTKDRHALLSLKDSTGKERARLSVGADDAARLEFLDDQGATVASYP